MNRKLLVREYVFATFGVILTSLGLVIFLIPNNIAAGGVSGLAMILNKALPISVGLWMYILNGILFVIAALTIGFDFSAKTVYCTFVLTFFVDLFDRIITIPKYTGEDMVLAVFFGVILTAVGMAITFTQNASTGGTDILARIANRYLAVSMGLTLLLIDFSIGILAGFSFGAKTGMYAILAIIINGITIDFVMKGIEVSTQVFVISEKNAEIASFVLNKLKRGATFIDSIGAYSGSRRQLLMTVLRRRELTELVSFIRRVDPKAFVVVSEARYALGEGFRDIKKIF